MQLLKNKEITCDIFKKVTHFAMAYRIRHLFLLTTFKVQNHPNIIDLVIPNLPRSALPPIVYDYVELSKQNESAPIFWSRVHALKWLTNLLKSNLHQNWQFNDVGRTNCLYIDSGRLCYLNICTYQNFKMPPRIKNWKL